VKGEQVAFIEEMRNVQNFDWNIRRKG